MLTSLVEGSVLHPGLSPKLAAELAELAAGTVRSSLSQSHRAELAAALSRVGVCPASAATALPPLSPADLINIFRRLPVDDRLRLAEVSRAFRAATLEKALWSCVDMSLVKCPSDALLLAASALAGGALVNLNLDGVLKGYEEGDVTEWAILTVVAANAISLRSVTMISKSYVKYWDNSNFIERLLCTAPNLAELHTDKGCELPEAAALLCNAPPYGALRLRYLHVSGHGDAGSLVPLLMKHASLKGLGLDTLALTPAVFKALLDAAVELCLDKLCFDCIEAELSSLSLVRLLKGGALKHLFLCFPLHDMASPAFVGALRGSSLVSFGVGGRLGLSVEDCLELLATLVRHPTIVDVDVSFNPPPHGNRKALGTALAALIAADSLRALSFDNWLLGNRGMRPVLDALKGCTKLRELSCYDCGATAGFARSVLLPAVQTNKSLRELTLLINGYGMQELEEAEALVKARAIYPPRAV